MKRLLIIAGVVSLLSAAAFAAEQSMLARVTVYWASGGSGSDQWTRKHQAATSVRLRSGHCAVDPRRIPYGSKVILPDATLTAVDTGGHVKSRRAARQIGRSSAQRSAIVIDRFFETKGQALAWAKTHPHFMTVRVVSSKTTKSTTTVADARGSKTVTEKVTVTKTTQSPVVAANKAAVPNPSVAKTLAASSIAIAANTPAPATRATGLRSSVRTARTSTVTAAPSLQPVPNEAPPLKQAIAANIAASNRLAANPTASANSEPAIMVHGPSHYGRAVAYLP
jgi:3D (Asp-Asp-Asp) domain-containing protein